MRAVKILLLAAAVAALTWPAWRREPEAWPPRPVIDPDAFYEPGRGWGSRGDIYDEIASGPAD